MRLTWSKKWIPTDVVVWIELSHVALNCKDGLNKLQWIVNRVGIPFGSLPFVSGILRTLTSWIFWISGAKTLGPRIACQGPWKMKKQLVWIIAMPWQRARHCLSRVYIHEDADAGSFGHHYPGSMVLFLPCFALICCFRFDIPDDLTLPRFTLTSGPARHGSEHWVTSHWGSAEEIRGLCAVASVDNWWGRNALHGPNRES